VVCASGHAGFVRDQLDELGVSGGRMILEPMARNTAPCAAAAARVVAADDPQRLILLLPADHHIADLPAFYRAIADGARAAQAGKIVTFGAEPTAPETGFGYIRRGAPIDGGYDVAAFVEKPDRARAEAYLSSGEYSWNAGIFLFSAQTMIDEMGQHCPDILESSTGAVTEGAQNGAALTLDPARFAGCRSESIDYAVMERTAQAAIVPVRMQWSDVGSWSAVWTLAAKNEAGCALPSGAIALDGKDNLVVSDGPLVTLVGVDDLVVVVDQGVVMITRRDRAQDVKKITTALADTGDDIFL
jgi:mannose-1-phosphate guanylyltransferase/mannose-6-phosphate isomerase